MTIKISLEFVIGKFISRLKLAIILWSHLYGIISEMYIDIFEVIQIVYFAAGSEITIGVPVSFQIAIDDSDHHVMSYVKFTAIVEKRFGDVGLNYGCFYLSVWMKLFFEQFLRDIWSFHDRYTFASICAFSWFYNPDGFLRYLLLIL